ncbi:MAG: hypothetical protein ABS46_11640 [Cytophagaceae bacterium SCN 52-12]|nr:MAG: hypothetical protein ABS46_11640 [Cytophagaceae bacterium SCN 52-12]
MLKAGAKLLAFALILAAGPVVSAQTSPLYLILLKDKNGTPHATAQPGTFLSERAIQRRITRDIAISESDLPVNPAYVAAISATGAQVLHTTRWFNGVVVSASGSQLQAIQALPCYKGIERGMALTGTGTSARINRQDAKFGSGDADAISYGNSHFQLDMLGVPQLHATGYTGRGLLIGVFDSGFTNADQQVYLSHLFENNQVVDTYDFIARNEHVYDDHSHGLQVLSVMASRWEGKLIGAAFDAGYVLYRTENADSETPYEEVAWLLAAERADSLGVDIINTSLGYHTFDNAAYDYTYAQMDGKTTIISRAARYAARTGMLVVASAGNEGNNSWKYITAPADVDSVLTVGAVTPTGARSSFSSLGPNAEGVIKPDVAALGSGVSMGSVSGTVTSSNGTSFSSPLIASFAALLWQVYPEKTAQELAAYIRSTGNKAGEPDDETGYGIPYYDETLNINTPTSFAASLTGNLVYLSWEHPYSGMVSYEIERSIDDRPFVRIATVEGALQPVDTLYKSGSYRYRVRTVANYRAGAYSEIAAIDFRGDYGPGLGIPPLWPNPARGHIFLDLRSFPEGESFEAEIISFSGAIQPVPELFISSAGTARIAVDHLPSGLFLLRLTSGGSGTYLRKFVKL